MGGVRAKLKYYRNIKRAVGTPRAEGSNHRANSMMTRLLRGGKSTQENIVADLMMEGFASINWW